MKVALAAIRDNDGTVYTVPRPGRHHDVIRIMVREYNLPIPITGEQGFTLDNGEFVNRKEARTIAKGEDQLISRAGNGPELYSEDLWLGFLKY